MTDFIQLHDEWTVIGPIGDNAGMSEVVEVERDGQSAVVKRVQNYGAGNRDLLVTELGDCRNIVPFDEIFEAGNELLLRMPKADGSLNQRLETTGTFEESDVISVMTDVATTLLDMGNIVVHRDIKPQNILRFGNAWCLADFGIARYVEDATKTMTYKGHGSGPWTAPERWVGERATIKSDVYSLGVVAYQLVTGELPFQGPDFYEQHRTSTPPTPAAASPLLRSLILSMLAKAPAARPNPAHILEQLTAIGRPILSPSISRLQQLAARNSEKKAVADAAAAAAQTKASQRTILAESAIQMVGTLFDPIIDQLDSIPNVAKFETTGTIQFLFESAELILHMPKTTELDSSLPFDVVCIGSISIEMANVRDGWAGRSHSLWYCDAHNEDEFHWFETAFHRLRSASRLEPYSRSPRDRDTRLALQAGFHNEQVAVPFTPLAGEAVEHFTERWLERFVQAAENKLPRPMMLPEGGANGSWRN